MRHMTYLFISAYFTHAHTHTRWTFFEGKVTRCDNSDNNDDDNGQDDSAQHKKKESPKESKERMT